MSYTTSVAVGRGPPSVGLKHAEILNKTFTLPPWPCRRVFNQLHRACSN